MDSLRRELYVYYRVAPGRAEAARAAVFAMQTTLANDHAGLQARLLVGRIEASGAETWMETYARRDGGIDAALEQAIEAAASALAPHIEGSRHIEAFLATD